jgi:predicted membrane protein
MSPDLDNRLAELTQRLGVSADRVWAALVRQAAIHAVYDLVIGALFAAAMVGVVAAYLTQGRWQPAEKVSGLPDPLPFGRFGNAAAAFVALLVLTLAVFGQLYEAASDFWNPDAYAYRRIFDR